VCCALRADGRRGARKRQERQRRKCSASHHRY
jgi:hypothetical protein